MKLDYLAARSTRFTLGHLLVAQAAVENPGPDGLFFIPAVQSPLKQSQKLHHSGGNCHCPARAAGTNHEIDEHKTNAADFLFG